jgi:hypothetical protein
MVKQLSGAVWVSALTLLAACTATPETGSVAPVTTRPEMIEAHLSPEFAAYGLTARVSENPEHPDGSIVTDAIGYFDALVGKPLRQPFTSLKRLVFLTARPCPCCGNRTVRFLRSRSGPEWTSSSGSGNWMR